MVDRTKLRSLVGELFLCLPGMAGYLIPRACSHVPLRFSWPMRPLLLFVACPGVHTDTFFPLFPAVSCRYRMGELCEGLRIFDGGKGGR